MPYPTWTDLDQLPAATPAAARRLAAAATGAHLGWEILHDPSRDAWTIRLDLHGRPDDYPSYPCGPVTFPLNWVWQHGRLVRGSGVSGVTHRVPLCEAHRRIDAREWETDWWSLALVWEDGRDLTITVYGPTREEAVARAADAWRTATITDACAPIG